ncbi:amidohydrolase family protein [Dactylosporangium aurantiacum]|uniref:Amidohydrolase family protein n=1 Tax=Dactylosporangium aurantiacum TaxID=35754 RepID=A0A9Q9ISS4_9ACTN|nr:amidohydrolase family protein [Dactylosporangium aurantiacum]MDG6106180.1 amidohydrolase family protein [Dactylosporangium aurantiacum]UWZ58318.1 amidohydrolase family protein [Dactylosporangium aurantiacum]
MHGFRADRAFDGAGMLAGGALVLVEDGAIVGVEAGTAAAPHGCPVTYLPGTTLLPGLIDTHTHLCGDSSVGTLDRLAGRDPDELDATIDAALAAHLRRGVTTVRDLGDQSWSVVDRHRGERPDRPRVLAAGPPLTSVGGHCADMGGATRGVAGLRRAVRERAERGADLVKVMTSGGVATAGTDIHACQFDLDEIRAVVDEAHRAGLPVTGHAHALDAVRQCLAAGVDGIEHCSCTTPAGAVTPPDLAAGIAAAGIAVCPTLGFDLGGLSALDGPGHAAAARQVEQHLAERRPQVRQLYEAGVDLISGVDSGIHPVKPHGGLAESVIDLVGCGVPAVTALASATGRAAQACGLAGRTGRLRPGLDADLLLVDGDPATDITALRAVRAVVRHGRPVA